MVSKRNADGAAKQRAEDPLAAAVRRRLTEADADAIADKIIASARNGGEAQIKLLRSLLEAGTGEVGEGAEAAGVELSLELARRVLRITDERRGD